MEIMFSLFLLRCSLRNFFVGIKTVESLLWDTLNYSQRSLGERHCQL